MRLNTPNVHIISKIMEQVQLNVQLTIETDHEITPASHSDFGHLRTPGFFVKDSLFSANHE